MRQRVTAFVFGLCSVLALSCIGVVSCAKASADDTKGSGPMTKPAPKAKAGVEPKADELLRKMSKSLAGTKQFQFDADHVLEVVTDQGERLQFLAESRVSVERPNKVRSDRVGLVADASVFYDGKSITIHGKRKNLYATTPAPGTLDEALDFASNELGIDAPAADLLYTDVYDGLMDGIESGRYVGLEPVGDRMCHHLAYRGADTDWQIWVEDGARALPCRYVITSKDVKGSPSFQVSFDNWNTAPKLAANHFRFTAPRGANEISFLTVKQKQEAMRRQTKKGAKP